MFDEYLAELDEPARRALQRVVDHVWKVAPEATEGRSYGVPAFRYRSKPLLGFAATKNHLSLYPFSPSALDSVSRELAGFHRAKGAVRFTADEPVPPDAITALVRARMAEIEGR